MSLPPFHLAIPVTNLAYAEKFYGEFLGCERGRSSEQWIDWNFFGHQLVTHLVQEVPVNELPANEVDSKQVPVPHYGVVLPAHTWEELARKFEDADYSFVIKPYIRFKGEVGEQGTFFVLDPCGNALEFKYFNELNQLFAN